jgi:hypothetical protein
MAKQQSDEELEQIKRYGQALGGVTPFRGSSLGRSQSPSEMEQSQAKQAPEKLLQEIGGINSDSQRRFVEGKSGHDLRGIVNQAVN